MGQASEAVEPRGISESTGVRDTDGPRGWEKGLESRGWGD